MYASDNEANEQSFRSFGLRKTISVTFIAVPEEITCSNFEAPARRKRSLTEMIN